MARRAHRAAHEAGLLRIAGGEGVRRFAGDGCAGPVDAVRLRCQSVVGQRNGVGVERVGRNYIRSGLEVFLVDFADCFRTGEVQQVVAASEKFFARGELLAPVVGFVRPYCCIIVPNPPSSSRMRCSSSCRMSRFLSRRVVFYWGMISISKSLLHLLPVTKIRSEAAS